MNDFKLRFAHCSAPGDPSSCEFSRVREGLIVSLLSIGTLIGALFGAPYVLPPQTKVHPLTAIEQDRRFLWPSKRYVTRVRCIHRWSDHSSYHILLLGPDHDGPVRQWPWRWWPQCRSPYGPFMFSRIFRGGCSLTNLQYQAETAPPQIRGAMT